MLGEFKSKSLRDLSLTLLEELVEELFKLATLQTDDVIVGITLVQFKDGLPALKVVTLHESRRFELRQGPVNRGQADFLARVLQGLVNILRREVEIPATLKYIEDFHARQGHFQTRLF
jgi:hypothetical protein